MRITLFHDGKKRVLQLEGNTTIEDVVKQLTLNQETLIVKRNGVLAHPASALKEGDVVEFVGIIYGG